MTPRRIKDKCAGGDKGSLDFSEKRLTLPATPMVKAFCPNSQRTPTRGNVGQNATSKTIQAVWPMGNLT